MCDVGDRAELTVDPRHDLVAQVRVVLAGARRVDELAAAEARPAVDHHDDARRWRPPSDSPANSASINSMALGRNADRLRHMSTWPLKPWIR